MKKDKKMVLQSIRSTLQQIAPAGTKVILFGSQARGDAHTDSDWDILIILDKAKLEVADYDTISYPLRELGWHLQECINPVMYTLKDWMKYSFSPFYHNVDKEGIVLL
ncbi:nucleotidyltransferase domain-containing protein [Phocaeicola sp.]|uniref:nucleotidyltransferase domain-containing protein n=1 Tax=Phocaeicola sp. TaxID=2773926 RepID=UPI0023D414EF|nr:nucleotidyltransferase domain-containing protein [Phocaeicola sp.]MDE5677358.1 nucleotidyltransferase domain-containing protein [Phocaeicola sp.]